MYIALGKHTRTHADACTYFLVNEITITTFLFFKFMSQSAITVIMTIIFFMHVFNAAQRANGDGFLAVFL